MTVRTFHYARMECLEDWLRLGWVARAGLAGTHHGEWSMLCEWLCECPLRRPINR